MKVSRLNAFFGKIGRAQVKYRWPILLVFFILTIICCAGLSKFAYALGDEGWYGAKDEIKINQKKYEETFGNINGIGVLLVMQDGSDVFSEEITFKSTSNKNFLRNLPQTSLQSFSNISIICCLSSKLK